MGIAIRVKGAWGTKEQWYRIQQTGLASWAYSLLAVWLLTKHMTSLILYLLDRIVMNDKFNGRAYFQGSCYFLSLPSSPPLLLLFTPF